MMLSQKDKIDGSWLASTPHLKRVCNEVLSSEPFQNREKQFKIMNENPLILGLIDEVFGMQFLEVLETRRGKPFLSSDCPWLCYESIVEKEAIGEN